MFHNYKLFLKPALWLCCMAGFFISCKNQPVLNPIITAKADSIALMAIAHRGIDSVHAFESQIRSGDIILRSGRDFTSESLRSLNQRNKTYSHCGIARIENDSVFVYHALGGEWNPDQQVRRDPIAYFADPFNNKALGIYRYNIDSTYQQHIAAEAYSAYLKKIPFDMDFDLKTTERLYCAELVARCVESGSRLNVKIPHSHIGQFEFIGVDDLFLHQLCIKLKEITYH